MSNKFEKIKQEKDGLKVKEEIAQFAQMGWEQIPKDDLEVRLKWLGVFFRPVTPGRFMMRLRLPNGIATSQQLRTLAEIIDRYGEEGSADITTRQNIQLRGIVIEDLPEILSKLEGCGLTSVQSGMDNVRNLTGSPVAGICADELIDTRPLLYELQAMLTNNGQGNPEFTNLPRKFNIAIEGGRDNSVHAEINDLAFVPAYREGILGFNVLVGGFFSSKRCAAAIPLHAWVTPDRQVIELSRAVVEIFRDHGLRENRQKARLMWLIDEWGIEKFRAAVQAKLSFPLLTAAEHDAIDWEKRDHIGVYKQKQPGLNYVGMHVPVGRLQARDLFEFARLAEVYGQGEVRFTVEQNAIIPHIPDEKLADFLAEPLLQKFSINPLPLERAVVSCTGAQFCNFAIIETKQRAIELARQLDALLELPRPVRIHWTGCPNSCGQPQVADIGLMGTKARKNGQVVDGVDLYMGGKVGKDAQLGTCVRKAIPCDDLLEVLKEILIEQFGARPRVTAVEQVA
ncbi:MAG: ferredoxin--nitrite reductase [Pseudanabaenaceae cyanobacterium SKYGB_i_bin29]|nr:ferredoxin--nitrite reductase [Pseudanabaenaceae cyanobacterium SKYG29]MDW8422013.1 ferredoxin--nitrite reductase [Pseudanabaenaceae cyanobacterium SKYGB_i_bin29]